MSTREEVLLKSGVQLKAGSCFFGHKWTMWRQYEQPIVQHGVDYIQHRQERVCTRCGYVENEKYVWINI